MGSAVQKDTSGYLRSEVALCEVETEFYIIWLDLGVQTLLMNSEEYGRKRQRTVNLSVSTSRTHVERVALYSFFTFS